MITIIATITAFITITIIFENFCYLRLFLSLVLCILTQFFLDLGH